MKVQLEYYRVYTEYAIVDAERVRIKESELMCNEMEGRSNIT